MEGIELDNDSQNNQIIENIRWFGIGSAQSIAYGGWKVKKCVPMS